MTFRIFSSFFVYSSVYLRISHARLYRDMTKKISNISRITIYRISRIAIYRGSPGFQQHIVQRKCLFARPICMNCVFSQHGSAPARYCLIPQIILFADEGSCCHVARSILLTCLSAIGNKAATVQYCARSCYKKTTLFSYRPFMLL